MDADQVRQQLGVFRKRLLGILWCRRYLVLLSGYLFVMGILVLLARWFFSPDPILWLGALALGLTPALPAWFQAKRRLPDDTALTALLDRHNGAGGLLMGLAEAHPGGWEPAAVTLPSVRLANQVMLQRLVPAAVFFFACALVPTRWLQPVPQQAPDLTPVVARLAEQVALLEETRLLDEGETERLAENLDQAAETGGDNMGATWEAMDHLEARVQAMSEEAAQQLTALAQQLNNLEALNQALGKAVEQPEFAEAVDEYSELIRRAGAENTLLNLDAESLKGLSELSPAQRLDALQRALQRSKAEAKALARKLAGAPFQAGTQKAGGAGEGGDAELAAFLDQLPEGKDGDAMAACLGGLGAVNRGPGNAPMTWQNPGNREGISFEEQSLPPSALERIEESKMVGLDAVAPEENGRVDSQFGALNHTAAGRGTAQTQTILPRHRAAVRRFFKKK